ncbi:MAG TPA: hypothetical protein VGZ22_12140 [Isosphaeraceae bacterium]|jgi:hypothetical protein|nr:hypothetical protein [Isosphaeraceae bacterium]
MLLRTVGDEITDLPAEAVIPDQPSRQTAPDEGRQQAASGSSFCPWRFVVSRFWKPAELDGRFIEVVDYAMQPLILPGAFVGYSAMDEAPDTLDGKLVVAWIEGRPIVRWLHRWGRFAVLRSQTESLSQVSELIDLDRLPTEGPIRRVLWVSIPQ